MPDKHEVDGSIPFEPTTIWNYKQAVQSNVKLKIAKKAH